MPGAPLRILLADDHRYFREGVRAVLAAAADMEVVGEAANGDEIVAQAVGLEPDVILMDLQMPGLNGVEATRKILRARPQVGILMVTMFEDTDSVLAAMRAGARGYILKDAEEDELLRSIRAVASGEALFGPTIATRLMNYIADVTPAVTQAKFPELTDREREVLALLAQGLSTQEVASRMGMTLKTARNHTSNILAKLQVADRAEAIARARAAGLGSDKG